jgi:hypothetical protein
MCTFFLYAYLCVHNNPFDMKRLVKLLLALVVIFFLVKLCSDKFGNVIPLPGGLGKESTEDSGGWFRPKEKTDEPVISGDAVDDMDTKELERELGIGKNSNRNKPVVTPSTPSTPSSASSPLSFRGVPMTGSLSAFGSELVKLGYTKAGGGAYTGDFAGYSGCRITPSGGDTVQEVRVDFPVISDWSALEKAYDSLQASLTQKYGIEPKTSENSNVAVYDLPGGTITLDADVADKSTWHVILKYTNDLSLGTTGTLGRNPIDDL